MDEQPYSYWITLQRVTLAGPYGVSVFFLPRKELVQDQEPGEIFRNMSPKWFHKLHEAEVYQNKLRGMYEADGVKVRVSGI